MKKLTILAPAAAVLTLVLSSCTTPETTTTTTSTTRESAAMTGAVPDPMGPGMRANTATMPRGGGP